MADVTITQEDDGRHGRYVARIAGIGDEAELTFTHRGPGLVSADHTGAPESMRGTGAAAALVDFLIADARHSGFRILPLCPSVRPRSEQHPAWKDGITPGPAQKPAHSLRPH